MSRLATLVVCGAHLQGQPLNPALMALGAVFIGAGLTAPVYRMYALPALVRTVDVHGLPEQPVLPPRPGLVRQADPAAGAAIEVELYQLPVESLGELVVSVAPPLAVGHVLLADGSQEPGFVCEGYAVGNAPDITGFGNWRSYLQLA